MDGVFAGVEYKIENSIPNEHNGIGPLVFQYKSLCVEKPIIWIPNDRLGISNDKITRISQHYSNIRVSNKHISLDEKGRVTITQNPSGLSEIELIKL